MKRVGKKILASLLITVMLLAMIPLSSFSAIAATNNLITNGDFETGSSLGWSLYQETSISANASYSGSLGVHIVGNGDWGLRLVQSVGGLEIGKSYVLAFFCKVNSVGVCLNLKNLSNTTKYVSAWITNQSWEFYAYEFTATETQVSLAFTGSGSGSREDVYVDAVRLVEQENGFDGVVNDSIINGGFESGVIDGWNTVADTGGTVLISDYAAYSGQYGAHLYSDGGWGFCMNQRVSTTPGKTYALSFWAKSIGEYGVNVNILDDNSNKYGAAYTGATALSNGTDWKKYTLAFKAESYSVNIRVAGPGGGVPASVYFDDVVLKDYGFMPDLANGDLECGDAFGWEVIEAENNGAVIADYAAHTGRYGAHVYSDGTWRSCLTQEFITVPGKAYAVSFWANVIGASGFMVNVHDASYNKNAQCYLSPDAHGWKQHTVVFTATSSCSRITISGADGRELTSVYVDDFVLADDVIVYPEPNLEETDINPDFVMLAKYFPKYLSNDAEFNAVYNCLDCCNEVIQGYDETDCLLLSIAESLVNGTKIKIKDVASKLGIGQSTEEEWLQKNTTEYLRLVSGCEDIIYDEWGNIKKKYKDFKFSLKGIDTMDSLAIAAKKSEFIKAVSGRTACLSEAEAEELADTLIKKQPNGISKFFSTVDYAADLADIMLFSCQMLEVETSVLKRLQDQIESHTSLYQGIEMVLEVIEEDPSGWVVEKYITDKTLGLIQSKVIEAVPDWIATTVLGLKDFSVIQAAVNVTISLLYNYVYQGAKIDEIYGAIVAYDFYATVATALLENHAILRQCKANNETVTEQMLLDFIFMYEAQRMAILHYTEACITIDKYGYVSVLESYQEFFADDGDLAFDNYIALCMRQLRNDIKDGTVICDHVDSTLRYCVKPTCLNKGFNMYVCNVCQQTFNTDYVAALGHRYQTQEIVQPGCTTQGYTIHKCSQCVSAYTDSYTIPNGHVYDNDCDASCNSCSFARSTTHQYDNAYDSNCNICGVVRLVDTLSGGNSSISEDVNGLGFKFNVAASGGQVVNGTRYVNGSAQIILSVDERPCRLVRMGAVVSNRSDAVLELENENGVTIINVEAVYLFEWDEHSLSYAVRIINIPEMGKDTEVFARPYYVYEKDGEEVIVYGDIVSNSYNAVLNG